MSEGWADITDCSIGVRFAREWVRILGTMARGSIRTVAISNGNKQDVNVV